MISDLTQKSKIKASVFSILNTANNGHAQLLKYWQQSIDLVWDNDTATISAILQEMGTDAATLFSLSTRTYQYLEQNEPGCTADRLVKVKPYTAHQDGTVTLD